MNNINIPKRKLHGSWKKHLRKFGKRLANKAVRRFKDKEE